MNNRASWQDKLEDPYVRPVDEINRVKEIADPDNLTRSHWDWNYQQQLMLNTFDAKAAFDTVISTMERSYYHDMLELDLVSGFCHHKGNTTELVATNTNPDEFLGGDLDRIPMNHLQPRSRGREISLIATENTHNGYIVNNPITHRAQPEEHFDFYGKDLAANMEVTWFRYVWNWEFIDPLNRELFERTKLLNRWLDKDTFCHYHDIFQHSLLVYINGLPVNDFEVMFTPNSNVLKLPFDNKLFMEIQKGNSIPLTIYRISSRKQYWANLNYLQMMEHDAQWDAKTWTDYADIFEETDSDLVILNLCAAKTMKNLGKREEQKTQLMQGIQTVFLHLHKREDGTNYIDLNDLDPEVNEWWKSVNYVTADIIRPKNMHEYTASGKYPYAVTKDEFPDEKDAKSYNREYQVIDLTHEFDKDNGQFVGVTEEDFLTFKQVTKTGSNLNQNGWRPVELKVEKCYPNTFKVSPTTGKGNDIVEILPYADYYDTLNDLNEFSDKDASINVTNVQVEEKTSETVNNDPLPDLRVFYFTKTLYKDTLLDPIMLQALKTARRYLFNPYRYIPPIFKNLKEGTSFIILENGHPAEYIVLKHDTPIPGRTLCIRKHAIMESQNDNFDFYEEQFTTPTTYSEWTSGNRYHLYGRFGIPALQHMQKESIPYQDYEFNIQYKTTRFFDVHPAELIEDLRICTLEDGTPVKYRLRNQSAEMQTYGLPHERPAYQYMDENGVVRGNMKPNETLYLRPCILIDENMNFLQYDSDIHVDLPDYLTPYPLTHFNDQELLKVISTNKTYFMKYFKLLFPGETFYGEEKFYKYSDNNMANQMQMVEHVPSYDVVGDGITGTPTGDGTIVVDKDSMKGVTNQKFWRVTKATIAYIPDKVDPHHTERGWERNYTINTHVMSSTGVELVVNQATFHSFPTVQYRKDLFLLNSGSGYELHDKLYIRNKEGDEFVADVTEITKDGGITKIHASSWTDTKNWDSVAQIVGGHGSGVMFLVNTLEIQGTQEADYYPWQGMELHVEHDTIYDHDVAGTYLPTTIITGTGEGLLVNIETENVPYDKESDKDAWMYPFDYLTLKLKNFIYLHNDNFSDYLKRQFKAPYSDWRLRVFQDTDLYEYKRYHRGNLLTYNEFINDSKPSVKVVLPTGYHVKLKDICAYLEHDSYTEGNEDDLVVYGKHIEFSLLEDGNIQDDSRWLVMVNNDVIMDPEQELTSFTVVRKRSGILGNEDMMVHLEFPTIRDSVHDDLWQTDVPFEKFDRPKFMVKFNHEDDTKISYRPFVAGFEKEFCEVDHIDESDYVYYDWEEVNQLKNSFLIKPKEDHKLYKIKQYKLTTNAVEGLNFHPGMELHLVPNDPSMETFEKVQILAIVDRVQNVQENAVLELHIHDFQRVFLDYDPTGEWKVLPTDLQRAYDKFHIGDGEQNSTNDWERIQWFAGNKESTITPTVQIEGELVEEQHLPAEKHYVSTNNTFMIRKLFHYSWEEEFTLDEDHPEVILSPTENPYNEVHLEDLRIVDTDTNQVVPFDAGNGQELFSLEEIIPDVNRSIQFHTRYDMQQIRIGESMLNLNQKLYDVKDATCDLRFVSDIRETFRINQLNINPNAYEYVEAPICLINIEPGNHSICMDNYYIPEEIFRQQWDIPHDMRFDYRDYTLTHHPMKDTEGNVIFYCDIDIRHTTLPFNFEGNTEKINDTTTGTDTHDVVNSYIRIKHIYHIEPADGIEWITRDVTIPSASSHYNNHEPEAYSMGEIPDIMEMPTDDPTMSHRPSNGYSYEVPPIMFHLEHKMREYVGVDFTYANGYLKKLFHLGENKVTVHLRTELDSKEYEIRVYIGRREDELPLSGNWQEQDAYFALRPPFNNQNYQHKYGNEPHRENHGRGQYQQQVQFETFYQPSPDILTSGTNTFEGNFGNPKFTFPEEETPLYRALYHDGLAYQDITVGKEDNYYPKFDEKYTRKIHENTMRNSGYYDADFTPYYAQFAVWYKIPDMIIQNDNSSGSYPFFEEDWLIPYQFDTYWDYEHDTTLNQEKEFTLDAYTNFDKQRNELHHENVHHHKLHITLWQSPDPKEGFSQHTDKTTGLVYSVKCEMDKPDRMFVPWTKFNNKFWSPIVSSEYDHWWDHINKPFCLKYTLKGRIETNTGIDRQDRVLHSGNYWVLINPKANLKATVMVGGTMEEINSYQAEEGDQSLLLDGTHYALGTFSNGLWKFDDLSPDICDTYTVLMMHNESRTVMLMYLNEEFVEHEDADIKFSPDGDRFELYTETGLYRIYTAYERGIIGNLHSYSIPVIQCNDLSYLHGTDYVTSLFTAGYLEKVYSGNPYFYEGYQKFYAQIVSTMNEDLMWIPVWTYIGDVEPPYDEDDPTREWHRIDQNYINRDGEEKPVWVAYHKEDFPKDIPQKIKDAHHTYFDHNKDIYYTCRVSSRFDKKHELSVYPTPRYSVHELSYGVQYTDIQYRMRITGKPGNYKAYINLDPLESESMDMQEYLTRDRLHIRATREDGSTYNVPLLNDPSMVKPLDLENDTTAFYHGIKSDGVKWTLCQDPYPINPIISMRQIPSEGVIDFNHPYLRKIWIRSALDSDRYELLVNGRLLTHGDQYYIISPTKIIMHGLTSLHNLELQEINREPSKELFRPNQPIHSILDTILEGKLVDGTYDQEFNNDEKAMFIQEGVWPQVSIEDDLYPMFPVNVDMDPDIRDGSSDDTDYLYMTDLPYIEGAPLVTNVHWGNYYPYLSAGMDLLPISFRDITDFFHKKFSENYWEDPRYRDHVPTEIFGEKEDTLPGSNNPPMLEREWVRYRYSHPTPLIASTFRKMSTEYSKEYPQIPGRFNWKGWHNQEPTDAKSYVLWKFNRYADETHPWENQGNNSYYEPDKVFVENDPDNYFAYLGDYIQSHYDAFEDLILGNFRGYNGWYPWKNPDAPYISNTRYWDTDRIRGKVGGLTQAPYSVQVNNDLSRKNPEIFSYEYIGDYAVKLHLSGIYETDSDEGSQEGVVSARLLIYESKSENLVRDVILPIVTTQNLVVDQLDRNTVYDVVINIANRAGIQTSKKFKIDPDLK